MNTPNFNFDPTQVLNSVRDSFAPALQAQEAGFKSMERLARYQYAVAGDYLAWSASLAKAALAATTPTEFFAQQSDLGTKLGAQLQSRGQELSAITSEVQATLTQLISDTTAKLAA